MSGEDRGFELVETMLRHIRRRQDNDTLIQTLKSRFVSSRAMLNATPFLLEQCGMHRHDALLFSKIGELARCTMRNSYVAHPQLGRLPLAAQYLVDTCYALKIERFDVLCLDKRGRMKERLRIQEGTDTGTLFHLRKILAETMRVDPCAIIFCHNHPRGTLRPSQDDINCTRIAMHALECLHVPLLDHIIIAGSKAVSMRDNGFIPAHLWMQQAPDNKLLKNWLSEEPLPNVNNYRVLKNKKDQAQGEST